MANLIIKASSGNSLVVQGADDSPAITVATDGATTFAENATMSGTLGVTGNTTLSGTANTLGTVTAGTLNQAVVHKGNMTKLATINQTSAVSGLSIDGHYTADYDTYIYVINSILFGGTNWMKLRVNEGGTTQTTGDFCQSGVYHTLNSSGNANSTTTLSTSYGADHFIGPYWGGNHSSFTLTVYKPLAADATYIDMVGFTHQASVVYLQHYGATWNSDVAISGIYLFPNGSEDLLHCYGSLYGVS